MNVILNWGEMPKNCRACHYDMHDTDNARWCVAVSGEFKVICEANQETDKDKRADWCPLLEVKPVQHGKWIRPESCEGHPYPYHWDYVECSECGFRAPSITPRSFYCANCGAKMDGGAE